MLSMVEDQALTSFHRAKENNATVKMKKVTKKHELQEKANFVTVHPLVQE